MFNMYSIIIFSGIFMKLICFVNFLVFSDLNCVFLRPETIKMGITPTRKKIYFGKYYKEVSNYKKCHFTKMPFLKGTVKQIRIGNFSILKLFYWPTMITWLIYNHVSLSKNLKLI